MLSFAVVYRPANTGHAPRLAAVQESLGRWRISPGARHGMDPGWMCWVKVSWAATGEIPLKWAKNKEEKPFHSRAGKPWAREAAAISPVFPWAPPTPMAPQSLIALGKPKGKE